MKTLDRKMGGLPSTMQGAHAHLMTVHGLGSFLAGQIVADVRHVRWDGDFTDSDTWAPVGPGSARGMRRLLGEPVKRAGFPQTKFIAMLRTLREVVELPRTVEKRIEAMDLQNCLCEFDKYSRIFEGNRPRRLYP